jgi:hypothetical protein
MRKIVAAVAVLAFIIFTPQAARAQEGQRLALAAVQASKEFKAQVDKAAGAKTSVDLTAPPFAQLFATIFDVKALRTLPPPKGPDLPWLSEWLGVAASSYIALINFGTDPKSESYQQAVQANVDRHESELSAAMDFMLRLMPRLASSATSFMQALSPAEREQPARKQGFAQVRGGYMQTVSGAITFISGPPKPANARLVSLALRDTVQEWSRLATPEERTDLLNLLAQARLGVKDAAAEDHLVAVSTAVAAVK